MAKQKVGRPKQSNNNTQVQSGVNLTGATMSSQSHELETSSVADHDATTTPPPAGGGSKTGAQESPSTSDVKLEYNIILLLGLLKVFLPKACMQRSLCRWSLAQSFKATANRSVTRGKLDKYEKRVWCMDVTITCYCVTISMTWLSGLDLMCAEF